MIDPQKSVATLVLDHPALAAVLQRHKVDYCCHGDITLADACRERRLDVDVVTRELEAALRGDDDDEPDARTLATPALVEHIVSRYHEPLRKMLPFVRMLAAKVARVHGAHNPRLKHLDEVVAELAETLAQHLDDEEATLFPSLAEGEADGLAVRLLDTTRAEHEGIGELLGWMRTAAEDYSVPDWACNSYRTLFRELERLEADVHRHVHVENHVLLHRAGTADALSTGMDGDYDLNHARHPYNLVEPDENVSYTETTTPTEDTNPREPGPPEEFGTSRPHSRG